MEEMMKWEKEAIELAKDWKSINQYAGIQVDEEEYEWLDSHPHVAHELLAYHFNGIIFNFDLTDRGGINGNECWLNFEVMTKENIECYIEEMNLNFFGYQATFKLTDALKEWGLDYDAINNIDVDVEQFIADYVAELANKSETGHWQAYRAWGKVGAVNTDLAYVTNRDYIRPYNMDNFVEEDEY